VIILSGEKNGQLFDFLKNEPIDAIIGYLTNNDLINIVYYKVIFDVILERNKEIDNDRFLKIIEYIGTYNYLDFSLLYKEFIDRKLNDELVLLINKRINIKCNEAKKKGDIRYIKQSIKNAKELEYEIFDSEEEGSIPFFSVGFGELYFSSLWNKYILSSKEETIIKQILLENPIMLNRLSPYQNQGFIYHTRDPYREKIGILLWGENFPWDAFNEIADKVSDYSIEDFLDCVPQNRKNYIVSYMCECNEIRYRYLLRRYFKWSDVPPFSPEERKNMLTRGKEDGSWLSGEAAEYISYPNFPVKLLYDDINKFGTFEIKCRFLMNKMLSYKDAIGIIEKETDIKQRFKMYVIKQGNWLIIKHPNLFSLTFEDYSNTAQYSLGRPIINSSEESGLNEYKFKQIIIKLIYDCNFTDRKEQTISKYLEKLNVLIPLIRDKKKENTIREKMKTALKEVIEELNAIGIRIRKDNSLVEVEKTIEEEGPFPMT